MTLVIIFFIVCLFWGQTISQRFNNFDLTGSFEYWFHEVERSANVTVEGDGQVAVDRPFLFRNLLTGREAIICFPSTVDRINLAHIMTFSSNLVASSFRDSIPKTAPSTEVTFFHKLRNSTDSKVIAEQQAKFTQAFRSSEVPRILFIQNPYSHFIRQQQQQQSSNGTKYTPQHQTCSLDSMAYDYIFPVEELDCWVAPLMRSLNLPFFGASTNWSLYSLNRDYSNQQDTCFYHLPGYTCQTMYPATEQYAARTRHCLLAHHPASFKEPSFPLSMESASTFSSISLPLVSAEEEFEADLKGLLAFITSHDNSSLSEKENALLAAEARCLHYRALPSFPQLFEENVNLADWALRSIVTQLLRPDLGQSSGDSVKEHIRRRAILEGYRLFTTTPQPAFTLAYADLHLPYKVYNKETKTNTTVSIFDEESLLDPWLTHWPRILVKVSSPASELLPLNLSASPTHQRRLLPPFVSYLPAEEQQRSLLLGTVFRDNTSSSRHHFANFRDYRHNLTTRRHLEHSISYVQYAHMSSLLNTWIGSRMHDGVPFLFINRFTGKRAIFCLHPKAGSSSLKFLLRYGSFVSGRHYRPHYTVNVSAAQLETSAEIALKKRILNESPHSQKTTLHTTLLNALQDPSVPRIMMVRNPFVRFLSGFLDKILKDQDYEHFAPPGYEKNDTDFVRFAKLMTAFQHIKETESGYHPMKEFNDHFRLMSGNCLLPKGVLYDYVLPIEQMQCWYEPLLAALQLDEVSKSGWNETTSNYRGKTSCFYQKKGADSCDDMFKEGIWQQAAAACQRPKMTPHGSTSPSVVSSEKPDMNRPSKDSAANDHTYHVTGSVSKLPQYYQSSSVRESEVVRLVAHWLQPDLHALQYPLWRPDLNESASQYLDKLRYFD